MTKKIMMVAVLLGTLTLGACVDNKESASVEAVRTAKAAQLNSIAAMNNAEAAAKKIISEADVAFRNAETALKNAEAEFAQAEADKRKAEVASELEVLKIETETNIANAKADLEVAKAALIKALDNVSIATKERIDTLLAKANTYLGQLNTARTNLVKAKNELIGLKYGLISAEALREKTIISKKVEKATAEALITEYQKYNDNDLAAVQKAADEAEATAKGLKETMTAKTKAATVASTALTTAKTNANQTLYYTTLDAKPSTYYNVEDAAKVEKIDFVYDNGTASSETKLVVTKRVAKLDVFQSDINEASRNLAILKATQAEAQKALNDKKATQGYKDQAKAVTDAQADFNAATTAAEKATAKIALDDAEDALKAQTTVEESNLETAKTNVTNAEKTLADANYALASVSGDNATAYDAAIAKIIELRDANATAQIASAKATNNHTVQDALATGLRTVATGYTNFADLILAQKSVIALADKTINDADQNTVLTQEQAIATKENEIAKLEVELKVNEAAYADYMTQIQALIQGE